MSLFRPNWVQNGSKMARYSPGVEGVRGVSPGLRPFAGRIVGSRGRGDPGPGARPGPGTCPDRQSGHSRAGWGTPRVQWGPLREGSDRTHGPPPRYQRGPRGRGTHLSSLRGAPITFGPLQRSPLTLGPLPQQLQDPGPTGPGSLRPDLVLLVPTRAPLRYQIDNSPPEELVLRAGGRPPACSTLPAAGLT